MTDSAALSCHDLHKHYGQHHVLQGIELAVADNSIHGLVGLNGAGKTTTLECILGLQPYDKGNIKVGGFPPQELNRARGKIAVVFDSPCLHPHLTVHQTLQYAGLVGGKQQMDIEEVQELLGITRYKNFKVKQLSLGNRRRTSIAQALINHPQFIILDEPFNGLDAGGVDDVLKLISRLNREQGTSFLLASHQLSYLEKICSHMAILHQGKICLNQDLASLLSRDHTSVAIYPQNLAQTKVVLSQIAGVSIVASDKTEAEGYLECQLHNISSAQLNAELVGLGIAIDQFILRKPTLENVFYQTIESEAA